MEAGQECIKCGINYGRKRRFTWDDSPPMHTRLCDPCAQPLQKILQDDFLKYLGDLPENGKEEKPKPKKSNPKGPPAQPF